jgi:hypothetical protein
MKIRDIITENILDGKGKIDPEIEHVLTITSTLPNQNMYHGSGYLHALFLKAIAGAGAGDIECENMGDKNWAGGDPVLVPFHPMEEEMINNAMKHIGDNNRVHWGSKRSEEAEEVNKASPFKPRGPIGPNSKKK